MNETYLLPEEPRGASQLIEIPVAVNGLSKITIPDQAQLRNQTGQIIIIKAIRLITDKVLVAPPTTQGTNAPLAELQKISLVLYSEGWVKAEYIPLLTMNDMVDADSTAATTIPYRNKTMRLDNWRNVDWTKSTLQYSQGQSSANAPYAVLLEVEYLRLDSNQQKIIGPA